MNQGVEEEGLGKEDQPASLAITEVTLETETESVMQDEPPEPVSTISTGAIYPSALAAAAVGGASGGDAPQPPQPKEFESISLEERRKPRRVIHFSDGVLEEYSTDEEDGEEKQMLEKPSIDPKTLTWLPYIWHYVAVSSFATYRVCDYLGEKLAYFFGITSPKYAYAISEYDRLEEDEKEDLKRQIEEREERRDKVAREEAERRYNESMLNQPEQGLPTSTH